MLQAALTGLQTPAFMLSAHQLPTASVIWILQGWQATSIAPTWKLDHASAYCCAPAAAAYGLQVRVQQLTTQYALDIRPCPAHNCKYPTLPNFEQCKFVMLKAMQGLCLFGALLCGPLLFTLAWTCFVNQALAMDNTQQSRPANVMPMILLLSVTILLLLTWSSSMPVLTGLSLLGWAASKYMERAWDQIQDHTALLTNLIGIFASLARLSTAQAFAVVSDPHPWHISALYHICL